ncbi:hypothetical protein HY477_02700 [Candidatus Uhrbacteria bacterium]|nr:hypothetical protein [Candidatus Uhrbacteria bacterium]
MRRNNFGYLKHLAVISLIFVGGFFYTQGAAAQTPPQDSNTSQMVAIRWPWQRRPRPRPVTVPAPAPTPTPTPAPVILPPTPPPPPTVLPDLAIRDVILTNDQLTFTYVNNADVLVNGSIQIAFQWMTPDGIPVSLEYWTQVGALGSREARTFSAEGVTVISGSGNQQSYEKLTAFIRDRRTSAEILHITIDQKNEIQESDEGNNVAKVLPVAAKPDLTIREAAFTSGRLTFTAANVGTGVARGPVSFWFEWLGANGERELGPFWYDAQRDVAAGGSFALDSTNLRVWGLPYRGDRVQELSAATVFAAPPPGTTALKVWVDGPNRIMEVDESNNAVILNVPLPDLTVTDLALAQGAITWKEQNVGDALEGGYTYVTLIEWLNKDGKTIHQQDPQNASSNTLRTGVVNYGELSGRFGTSPEFLTPPASAVKLRVTVDAKGTVPEKDEGNNMLEIAVPKPSLPPKLPDLLITDATLDTAALRFWYHNRGETATGSKVSFWYEWVDASGARVGELRWINVGAMSPKSKSQGNQLLDFADLDGERGKLFLREFVNTAPPSATHLKLTIDGPNAHAEANEQNNSVLLLKSGAVVKLPDLALTGGSRAGGVVKVTIANDTANTIRTPFLQFKWVDAKGAVMSTSPVSYWSGTNIAPGKTGEFAIEYEKWREDGVTRFLKQPPSGAAALLATIDPENQLKEANEENNSVRIALGQPDLLPGKVEVRDGALQIEVKNGGVAQNAATDIWLMWFSGSRSLPSSAAVDLPAIASGASLTVSVPFDGKTEASNILREPPKDGTRVRIYLDGSRKVEEANEQNNDTFFDRAGLPKAQVLEPKLELGLSVEIVRENAAAGAVSSFAGGGLTLALAALLAFGFMINAHHGGQSGAVGFFSIFPLLFTASNLSYMYLRRCGPQGCSGKHFARYRRLKNATRASLGAVVGMGVLKIVVAFLAVSVIGPSGDIYAQALEAYAGDGVRATFIAKNTGNAPATGMLLRLACPPGTAQTSVKLNDKEVSGSAESGIAAPDLKSGAAHNLKVFCQVGQSASGSLRFQGDAKYKEGGDQKISSNIVAVAVRLKPEPTSPPDLQVIGVGFLPKTEVTGEAQPFSAVFTGIVQNAGKSVAATSKSRLRLDIGSNGTWDFISPTLVEAGEITPGEHETASWTIKWSAPLGAYTFEICADVESKVSETSEDNNCMTGRFTLQVGQEAAQDEDY